MYFRIGLKAGEMRFWPFKKKTPPINPINAHPQIPGGRPFPPGKYTYDELEAEAARWGLKFLAVVNKNDLHLWIDTENLVIICEGKLTKPEAQKQEWVM